MPTRFERWLGGSWAIALLISAAPGAIAATLPTSVQPSLMPIEKTTAMQIDSLESTLWQLTSYQTEEGETVNAFGDRVATLQFQEGKLSGTTGCNRFFGTYMLEDETLTTSPAGTTLMACFPEALAQQESAILANLSQVETYKIQNGQLSLQNATGEPLMTFIVQPTATLTETEWTLTVFNNGRGGLVTPLLGSNITALFDEAGGIAGSAGCNTYRAAYSLDNNVLAIDAAASTRRFCEEPDGVMEQETAYLTLLQNAVEFSIKGNQLELRDATGMPLARFVANVPE